MEVVVRLLPGRPGIAPLAPVVRAHAVVEAAPADEDFRGRPEPQGFGEVRFGAREIGGGVASRIPIEVGARRADAAPAEPVGQVASVAREPLAVGALGVGPGALQLVERRGLIDGRQRGEGERLPRLLQERVASHRLLEELARLGDRPAVEGQDAPGRQRVGLGEAAERALEIEAVADDRVAHPDQVVAPLPEGFEAGGVGTPGRVGRDGAGREGGLDPVSLAEAAAVVLRREDRALVEGRRERRVLRERPVLELEGAGIVHERPVEAPHQVLDLGGVGGPVERLPVG